MTAVTDTLTAAIEDVRMFASHLDNKSMSLAGALEIVCVAAGEYASLYEAACQLVCAHLSADGVDTTPADRPEKVWRCCACGWEYRNETVDGVTRMVAAT